MDDRKLTTLAQSTGGARMKDLLLEEEVTGSSPDTEAAGLRKIEHHNAPLWYNLQIYTIAGRLVRALWINICQLRFGDSSNNHIS